MAAWALGRPVTPLSQPPQVVCRAAGGYSGVQLGPGQLDKLMGESRRVASVCVVRSQAVCLLERLASLGPGARAAAEHPPLGPEEEEGSPGIPAGLPPAREAGSGLCGMRELVTIFSSSL